jgi:hypothetical protein
MRGCLSVIVIAALFIFGAIWFGGPPLAGTVVEATLTGSGFAAAETDVDVDADPPLTLVAGRADRITIHATDVLWHGLPAGTMTLAIDDVDLFARTAGHVEGSFEDVELRTESGSAIPVTIAIDGPANGAETTIRVARATMERLALAAFEEQFNTKADEVALVAPNEVRFRIGEQTVGAKLELSEDGVVTAKSVLGTVRLVAADPAFPIELSGLAVADDGLSIEGVMDVASLLR